MVEVVEKIRERLIANLSKNGKQKFVVAMSGGVDSSVVAALLHDAGHDVTGITLQLYSTEFEVKNTGTCCAGKDIYDAQIAASKIGIPHYVFNYENNFKSEVIDKFAESYVKGETPIPCVLCNQTIKFKDLLRAARDLGADKMATGHYVQKLEIGGEAELHIGMDPNKDQSYFLFTTTREQLEMLEFPLGSITKKQTRELAQYYDLNIADKPDSQDICFVPGGNYREIVTQLRPDAARKGNIVLHDGTVLGKHDGVINYTVGQRKGLNISYSEPLYVIKIDPKKNEVIVGTKDKLNSDTVLIRDVNWLLDFDNHSHLGYSCCNANDKVMKKIKHVADSSSGHYVECTVKLRSSHSGTAAKIVPYDNKSAIVQLYDKYPGATPGQACVFYQGTRVLGGGWIESQK